MKKILTLFFLSILIIQSRAQILFSQNFESGDMAPMMAIDVDSHTLHPLIIASAGPTWSVKVQNDHQPRPHINHLAVSGSWFNQVGQADDWLISPPISITQANTFLVWQAFTPDASYRDGYEVRISTTDSLISSFTNLALNVPAENVTLTNRSLKLDDYIGQTIYFAFRNHSTDKFLLYIDNILVEILKNQNAIVKTVSFEKYNPVATKVPLNITVENRGAHSLTSLIFKWASGNSSYSDTITGLNIPILGLAKITSTFMYDVTKVGEFRIDVSVSDPNGEADEDPSNNFGTGSIYGLSEQLPKKVVVEERIATWCWWSPRGLVTMKQIAADYPEKVILIDIHNGDPMALPSYDSAVYYTIPGIPGGHIDRKELNVDPDSPSNGYGYKDAIEHLDERLVPVQVEVQTSYDAVTKTMQIKGTGYTSIATQANAFRFACAITEDNVTGILGYDQANEYSGGANGVMGGFENLPNPVPYSQMSYNFVARALLGGFDGVPESIPDALNAGEYFDFDFTYQVPEAYNINEMNAVIFILDEQTGEILNSDDAKLSGTVSINLVPQCKSALYPNPASDFMNLSVEFQTTDKVTMNIYDTNGRLIQSLGELSLANSKALEQISIAELNAGMYILELRHKNAVTALPFTKL